MVGLLSTKTLFLCVSTRFEAFDEAWKACPETKESCGRIFCSSYTTSFQASYDTVTSFWGSEYNSSD